MSLSDQQQYEKRRRSLLIHSRVRACVCICLSILAISIIAGFITLMIYFGPSHVPSPKFSLGDVKIYAFNVSTTTSSLTSNLKISLLSQSQCIEDVTDRWGNLYCDGHSSVGFHYDNIDVYASYKKQQITQTTILPPSFQGKPNSRNTPDTILWNPYLNGTKFPVSPNLAVSLAQDMTDGGMLIDVVVKGHMSSKRIFKFRSRFEVTCMAYIMFGNNINDTSLVGYSVRKPFVQKCHVHVKRLH